jgi:hypothetical protein
MWVIIMGQAWVSHSNCMQLQVASHQWTWDVSSGMGSILHGMRPREHIVDCISHTACPITHSHTLVMQCYYDLLCIYTVIYTYIYTDIYIYIHIIYHHISHHGHRTLSVQIVSLGPLWKPSASPSDEAHRRTHQADLQQRILRSALASHGDSHTAVHAMAVAKQDDMVGLFGQWW